MSTQDSQELPDDLDSLAALRRVLTRDGQRVIAQHGARRIEIMWDARISDIVGWSIYRYQDTEMIDADVFDTIRELDAVLAWLHETPAA